MVNGMAASPYHPLFVDDRKKLTLCPIHMPETTRTLAEAFISNRTGEPFVSARGCHCMLGSPLLLAQFAATQAVPRNRRSARQLRTKRIGLYLLNFLSKSMYQIVIRITLYGKKLACAGLWLRDVSASPGARTDHVSNRTLSRQAGEKQALADGLGAD